MIRSALFLCTWLLYIEYYQVLWVLFQIEGFFLACIGSTLLTQSPVM